MGMIQYCEYDNQGNVISTGVCSEKNFNQKKAKGQKLHKGKGSDLTDKIENGKIKKRPVNEQEAPIVPNNERPLLRVFQDEWDTLVARVDALENP